MKSNLSIKKPKLNRILVCTLLIAFVFQITAISMVQATSETVPEDMPVRPPPDDNVVPIDDPVIIAPKDPVLISTEDGEIISHDEPRPVGPSPDDTVVISSDDPVIISPRDPVVISEGGEVIAPENSTIARDEEIEKTVPDESTTIGVDTENSEEDYQPLIAPQPGESNTSAILGVGVILAVVAVVAVVFFVRRSKKIPV